MIVELPSLKINRVAHLLIISLKLIKLLMITQTGPLITFKHFMHLKSFSVICGRLPSSLSSPLTVIDGS